MQLEDDHDAVAGGEVDHRIDLLAQVGVVELVRLRLQVAPGNRQADEVEAPARHLGEVRLVGAVRAADEGPAEEVLLADFLAKMTGAIDELLEQIETPRKREAVWLWISGVAGDERAFEQIMLATEQRVVSIAWRMLGNGDDAREAAQEVYLRLFRYLSRFRDGEDFRAWLYRITVNVCHDYARKRRLADSVALDESTADLERAALDGRLAADPESLVLQEQQLALVRRALRSLPPKEREVYELRDINEVSGEETAVRLKISQAAMKSRLFRARTNLRRHLDEALIPTNSAQR